MPNRKRPPVVVFIIPLYIGLLVFYRVTQSPQFESYRTVDVVQLLVSGAGFGAALTGLIVMPPRAGDTQWSASAFAILAMAHHRLGHADEAHASLGAARRILAKKAAGRHARLVVARLAALRDPLPRSRGLTGAGSKTQDRLCEVRG